MRSKIRSLKTKVNSPRSKTESLKSKKKRLRNRMESLKAKVKRLRSKSKLKKSEPIVLTRTAQKVKSSTQKFASVCQSKSVKTSATSILSKIP